MSKSHPVILITLTCLALVLTSCTRSTSGSTPDVEANLRYTAAAETIAAQLTEINNPGAPTSTVSLAASATSQPLSANAPTEGLPDTSTPLPTKTPVPSDTPTPTNTSTLTLTPVHTNTPQPPPTATSIDPRQVLGEPDWQDRFNNSTNWPYYTDDHVAMLMDQGALSMTALKADKYEAMMFTWPTLTDFYLEGTFTTGECAGLDRYGLLARAPSFNPIQTYVFSVTCDGHYSLRTWDGSVSKFSTLIEWTPSTALKRGPDQTNVLGLRMEGGQISLYANGILLDEIADETFTGGYFGLLIGATNTAGFNIEISDVSYWELP